MMGRRSESCSSTGFTKTARRSRTWTSLRREESSLFVSSFYRPTTTLCRCMRLPVTRVTRASERDPRMALQRHPEPRKRLVLQQGYTPARGSCLAHRHFILLLLTAVYPGRGATCLQTASKTPVTSRLPEVDRSEAASRCSTLQIFARVSTLKHSIERLKI